MSRGITARDLYAIRAVADPNVSPDDTRLAFVVTRADQQHNRNVASIKVRTLSNDDETELSADGAELRSPRWSPDGRTLAYISDETGTAQLHLYQVDSSGSRQLTTVEKAITEFVWMPDGTAIIFASQIPDDGDADSESDTIVIRSLAYKFNGEGIVEGRRKHLHRVDIDSGAVSQVTSGDFDASQPAISPDGKKVAFTAGRMAVRETHLQSDVIVLDLATGELETASPGDGTYSGPSWSPGGEKLAFSGHPIVDDGPFPIQDRLYVQDSTTGEISRLMAGLDRAPGGGASSDIAYHVPLAVPRWSADGTTVYTLSGDAGAISIFAIPVETDRHHLVHRAGEVHSFNLSPDGTIYLAQSSFSSPPEIFALRDDAEPEQLTFENRQLLGEVDLGGIEDIWVESDPGVQIHSFVILPPGFDNEKTYPAILSVHGGPHGMYSAGFHFQLLAQAAAGYIVLMPNPRASTGYGQEILSGLQDDWGGADFRDVMASVDGLINTYNIDEDRIGITGESYGGYMANWAVGQTDRFAAAVTQNSSCNRYSLYGTADMVMMYSDREFGGSPYEKPENYLERSPLTYVSNVKTPVLILHCENDMRVPISQGEEWFVGLKKHGVETEFVRFPGEHHLITRLGTPRHRIERIERTIAWFNQHMG